MKRKEKILRVRPFNMANFSGGSGYLLIYAMYGWVIALPATLLLWAGIAAGLSKEENGTLEYQMLKRKLSRVLLPICLVSFAICAVFSMVHVSSYGGGLLAYGPAVLWIAAFYTIGIYCAMLLSAKMLNTSGSLSKGKWFLLTFVFYVLFLIIGIAVALLLDRLGGILDR